jgi:hypothetical protein
LLEKEVTMDKLMPWYSLKGRTRRVSRVAMVLMLVGAMSATVSACVNAPTPVAPDSQPTERSALTLDQRLCVTNDTGMTVKLTWSYTDTIEPLPNNLLMAGSTNCATGSNAGKYGLNVRVRWNDRLSQLFTVYNQTFGAPKVVVDSDQQTAMDVTRCGQVFGWYGVNYCSETFDENHSEVYGAYNYHESRLTRTADSGNYKEFTLELLK